jgi:Flp pilus assembly protein TadD
MTPPAPATPAAFTSRVVLLSVVTALLLCGCKSTDDFTGSLRPAPAVSSASADLRQYADDWGRRYEANPTDKTAAMNYARALRSLTQYSQAIAVLQTLSIKHPNDMDVLGAYGKALADGGRLSEAAEVLQRAHTPEQPNPSILSAQGSVADELGEHEEAQRFYSAALKIEPENPAILSNLGLSYALSKRLSEAETTSRQAAAKPAADMRVRQNLALILALQGKFDEAEQVARHDLSAMDAASNIAAIRQMISQSNTWRDIQKLGNNKLQQKRGA